MNSKHSPLVLVALAVVFLTNIAFAGTTPAPVPPADNPGQEQPGDSGQSGQSGQAGQADQGNVPQKPHNCPVIDWIKQLFKKPVTEKEAMHKLLELVLSDLDLCQSVISDKKVSYLKIFPAIEHVNHALGTLKKINPPKTMKEMFKQVEKRVSHIKFSLVMHDLDEARNRLDAASTYIKTIE